MVVIVIFGSNSGVEETKMAKLFVSNKNESARIFQSDFLEQFTKVYWTVPIYLFIPIILGFLYFAIFEFALSPGTIVPVFTGGLFFWTITEYSLHRFVFHNEPKTKIGERIHFIFHGVHHDYPNDEYRLVMPPIVSLSLSSMFYILFRITLGPELSAPFASGFLLGYLIYDISHYSFHHFAWKNKFMVMLKQHHMKHHFRDPNRGYGVSSAIWDIVFKTDYQEKQKPVAKNI